MSKSKELAQKFVNTVNDAGWNVSRADDGIVSITKKFEPGCNTGFVKADSEYYGLLSLVPVRGGSMWGTDGSGMGAIGAKRDGRFVMNVSGVGARFINALKGVI